MSPTWVDSPHPNPTWPVVALPPCSPLKHTHRLQGSKKRFACLLAGWLAPTVVAGLRRRLMQVGLCQGLRLKLLQARQQPSQHPRQVQP